MWLYIGKGDLPDELRHIKTQLGQIKTSLASLKRSAKRELEADMATNDELGEIRDDLNEAFAELSPLPGKIDELLAQVGDQADPALVAEIKTLSQGLADVVANPVVPEEPPVDGEEPVKE